MTDELFFCKLGVQLIRWLFVIFLIFAIPNWVYFISDSFESCGMLSMFTCRCCEVLVLVLFQFSYFTGYSPCIAVKVFLLAHRRESMLFKTLTFMIKKFNIGKMFIWSWIQFWPFGNFLTNALLSFLNKFIFLWLWMNPLFQKV